MEHFTYQTFPVFTTPRLELRQLVPEDARDVFRFRSNEEVGRYLSRPLEESLSGCRDFIENIIEGIRKKELYYWAIALPSGPVMGTICLWNLSFKDLTAEIGYELHPDFQKQGFMQEAIEAILQYAFETMKLQRIEAYLQTGNRASVRLLERNGFKFLKKVGDEEKFAEEADMQLVAYVLEAAR
ncbi:GNAT family N-acetyltransferase [Flavilitoribacter nigricans]|uniref:GNAT family N-acetyltransferase n=1 Tax=Flavilitoribacter nigricans (strain ATCC 23147 / DSM 23189 / NBRC 102662 / NCIMB 1420 / SS-2) TaxID=1122177 RepID=A0A2D0N921_FLAN2|nr:GNAT family N-acetyltransferase [Flavilitoribacter nigricans]PHN04977.1 GNAT family N-acetyltransferase [Flavilitoribacter nigricans DSM 23189 = NBRC 102662]